VKRELVLCVLLTLGFVVANVYITRPAPDNKKRTLVAEVREAGTDCPLPGALVRVGGIKKSMLTDSLGRIRFPGKVTLSREVIASLAGYEDGSDSPWLLAADTVAVRLELVPKSPRVVTGVVENGEGMPLPGARVWMANDTTVTDSIGRFALGQPHVSPLDVQVLYPRLPCCTREVRLAGHDSVAVHVALYDSTARGDIMGHVSDGWTGRAVIRALVTIGGTQFETRTNVDGDYAFRSLKPGDYAVVCLDRRGELSKRVSVKPNRPAKCDFHPWPIY
jgi:hypothetical protein